MTKGKNDNFISWVMFMFYYYLKQFMYVGSNDKFEIITCRNFKIWCKNNIIYDYKTTDDPIRKAIITFLEIFKHIDVYYNHYQDIQIFLNYGRVFKIFLKFFSLFSNFFS